MATGKLYVKFLQSLANKEIDLDTDVIKVALFTSALSISQTTNQYFDAAPYTANQVAAANGYTTGGATLGSPVFSTSGLVWTFDGADTPWTVTGAGFSYRYAIIYDSTPASNKPLIAYQDFTTDVTAVAGTHTIAWNASGIAAITVA